MSKKLGEKILEAMSSVLSRAKPADPHNKRSASVEQASDAGSIFDDFTPEERAAWNAEARDIALGFRMDKDYQQQPDNYTTADFIKDIEASEG